MRACEVRCGLISDFPKDILGILSGQVSTFRGGKSRDCWAQLGQEASWLGPTAEVVDSWTRVQEQPRAKHYGAVLRLHKTFSAKAG